MLKHRNNLGFYLLLLVALGVCTLWESKPVLLEETNVLTERERPGSAVQEGRDVSEPSSAGVAFSDPVVAKVTKASMGGAKLSRSEAPHPVESTVHFTEETREIVARIEAGEAIVLNDPSRKPRPLLLRASNPLAENFQIGLGADWEGYLPSSVRMFLGVSPSVHLPRRVLDGQGSGMHEASHPVESTQAQVSMAVVNGSVALEIVEPDGTYTKVRRDSETGAYRSATFGPDEFLFACTTGPGPDGLQTARLKAVRMPTPQEMLDREVDVSLGFESGGDFETEGVQSASDRDPSTSQFTKSHDTIPWGTTYAQSLKEVPVVWAYEKTQTGTNTLANLTNKAALRLALFGHQSAIFEYQVGYRNTLQELILIPDDPAFEDWEDPGAGSNLGNFRTWINLHRPNGTYRWHGAMGFRNIAGGVAYLPTFPGSSSVGVSGPWHFVITVHEFGHNCGCGHTSGGVMNPYVGDNWDFFTFSQNSTTKTAANDLYNRCNTRGYNTGILRHPDESPVAIHDDVSTAINTPLNFDPRSNDLTRTAPGVAKGLAINDLLIEEVSPVVPATAGTVSTDGTSITFTPTAAYEGMAWFSYTLRGNVGNNGRGWLHKGNVAVTVGSDTRADYAVTVPAGSVVELFTPVRPISIVAQPAQSEVIIDKMGYSNARYKLVIRSDASATGVETFDVNGADSMVHTITITYSAAQTMAAVDDFVPDNTYSGGLRVNPVYNDLGTGSRAQPVDVQYIVGGTATNVTTDQDWFDDSFRFISATNLDSAKGSIVVETRNYTEDSVTSATNQTGYLTFERSQLGGVARVDYDVADALGNIDTGRIHFILPMVTVDTPSENPADVSRIHESSGLVLRGTVHDSSDFPLSGSAPTISWTPYRSQEGTVTFADPASEDTTASFSAPGDYTLRVSGTDNGYTTWRQVRVEVHDKDALPTQNVGGYVEHNGATAFTGNTPYDLDDLGLTIVDDGKSGFAQTSLWEQVSGPGVAVFSDPTDPGTTVTLPTDGTYVFRLILGDGLIETWQDFSVWKDVDSDSDGLADSWENFHFGNLSMGPSDNGDGDPHTLGQEFTAGTDPTTGAHLQMQGVQQLSSNTVELSWESDQSGPGSTRQYQVYRATGNVGNTMSWELVQGNIPPSGGATTSYLASLGSGEWEMEHFRVRVAGAPDTVAPEMAVVQQTVLREGLNYLGMSFTPSAATLDGILGTDLPAAAVMGSATVVDFWNQGSQIMDGRAWLEENGGSPRWVDAGFNPVGSDVIDTDKGMLVTIRTGQGTQIKYLTGTTPEAATSVQTIVDDGYSLAVMAYPTERSLSSLGLVGAGFTGSTRHRTSDRIYFYNAAIQSFTDFVWYDTGGSIWRFANGNVANALQVIPGRVMLFERQSRGSNFDWTQSRPYSVPLSTP